METSRENNWTVFSVVVGSGVALLVLLTGPILVGAFVEILGLSEQNAGLIFSAEMFGFTCGAVVLFAALAWSWQRVAFLALSTMIVGNLAAIVAATTTLLVICRFVAGIGSGMLMTLTIVVIGTMRNTDMVYGLWTVGQLLLGAAGLIVFPIIIAERGLAAVFAVIALLGLMLFATVRFYSAASPQAGAQRPAQNDRANALVGLICLGGVFIYYAGQAAVWVYLERVGVSWNIDQALIAKVLFAGLFAGIVGAAIAVVLGDRAGRRTPVVGSLVVSAIAIALLLVPAELGRFAIAACLFNFGWYLFLPYSAAVIASVDRDGRLLTGLGVVFPASLAAGPAFAALFVGEFGLLGPLVIGLVSIPIGLVGILPATR